MANNVDLARQCFRAYETKDRDLLESLVADEFTFTSPYDDHINRAEYFERCWPNSETIARFLFDALAPSGDKVLALYECHTFAGAAYRNVECLTFADGKLTAVEVFFGDPPTGIDKWDFPVFVDVARHAWDQRLHSF